MATDAAAANMSASLGSLGSLGSLAASLDPTALLRYVAKHPYMMVVNLQIYGMAVAVIYAAAHKSLKRPPSAGPEVKEKDKDKNKQKKKAPQSLTQELRMLDALLFPVMGGCVLVFLYLLIQYLDDPSIISRLMRGNMIVLSVVSGGALFGSTLRLVVSVVFPAVWASRDGSRLYRIDEAKRQQQWADTSADVTSTEEEPVWTDDATCTTPFPDAVARLVPTSLVPAAWTLRAVMQREWTLPLPARLMRWLDMSAEDGDANVSVYEASGMLFSVAVCLLYLFASNLARPGVLNNALGIGACFVSLPEISGTSFVISSAVMVSMFVYDVVMVFYTPVMVTVATTVQAPVMVAARAGPRTAMLGLGDIVVPGIFVCLCLRYDQHRYYAAQIQTVATPLETETVEEVTADVVAGGDSEHVTKLTTTMVPRQVKAAYVDPSGHWGDWVWTRALDTRGSRASSSVSRLVPGLVASSFPRPYFNMSMASYVVGLVLANAAVEYTHKGQPALFYLVPVMLAATWGQAAWMGDLAGMWNYTEIGSLDTEEVVVDVDAEGKRIEPEEAKTITEEKVGATSSSVSTSEQQAQRRVAK